MKKLKFFILTIAMISSLCHAEAHASDITKKPDADVWQSLKSGDAVILMRHAMAPGTGDPFDFDLNDCSTQRNLSNEGRAQARLIGDVLRANGIEKASVLSSEWCRCTETAELLGFGQPVKESMLNSFYQDRSTANAQTSRLRSTISDWINSDKRVRILVTHQVNISALTGKFASSGEMVFVTFYGNDVEVMAKLQSPG